MFLLILLFLFLYGFLLYLIFFFKSRNELNTENGTIRPINRGCFLSFLVLNYAFETPHSPKPITPSSLEQSYASFSCPILVLVLSFEGRCVAYPVGVQLFLLMFYFGLGNELWKKKGHRSSVILAELFPQNVLSPEGSLLRRLPKGSNCFYFTFYWCRKRYPGFKIQLGLSHFFLRKCFIVTGGRVDGLTGGRVDGLTGGRLTKRSFNFFYFEIY